MVEIVYFVFDSGIVLFVNEHLLKEFGQVFDCPFPSVKVKKLL